MLTCRLILTAFIVSAFAPLWADPDPKSDAGVEVLSKYQEAVRVQQQASRNVSMEVVMEATIPKLKKQGRLNALRRISSLGKITYKVLGFSGDDTVKKEVMARYMTAEVEAAQDQREAIGITPANYEFKYKGLNDRNDKRVHVFEVKPR